MQWIDRKLCWISNVTFYPALWYCLPKQYRQSRKTSTRMQFSSSKGWRIQKTVILYIFQIKNRSLSSHVGSNSKHARIVSARLHYNPIWVRSVWHIQCICHAAARQRKHIIWKGFMRSSPGTMSGKNWTDFLEPCVPLRSPAMVSRSIFAHH